MKVSERAGRLELQRVEPKPFYAFIPASLPPNPSLDIGLELQDLLEKANRGLGRLDGITLLLPDTLLFLYMYVRKEAVLSSQIEGTQSSISDLLIYETKGVPGVPIDDVKEVSNYIAAMDHGLSRVKGGFPLSLRLIREMHGILLRGSRGATKNPGEFRRSQNWVGGSRPGNAQFVPPPANEVMNCLSDFEKYLHDEPVKFPLLIKAGLAHVQFESIHPFLDGNGRIGRLLITLMLCIGGALSEPLLYLSLFFKQNRSTYYDYLERVRTDGDWEGWLKFYLTGIAEVSEEASKTARQIIELFKGDHLKIQSMKKAAPSAFSVFEILKQKAVISIPQAEKDLRLTRPTIASALANLIKLGIVKEITGKQRDRRFVYENYLSILSKD